MNQRVSDFTKTRLVLDIVATLAIVVAAGTFIFGRGVSRPAPAGREPALPREATSIEGPERGDPGAPVAMVIYSDFECPFCARFARDTLPFVEKDYVLTGKVRVVLFAANIPLSSESIISAASQVGLSQESLEACRANARARVARDEESAKSIGLTGTPAILFGVVQPDGKVLYRKGLFGARPLPEVRSAIEEALRTAGVLP